MNENFDWFYLDGGNQQGPISLAEMRALCDAGVITHETYVWQQGLPNWQNAGATEQLIAHLPKALSLRTHPQQQLGEPKTDPEPQRPDTKPRFEAASHKGLRNERNGPDRIDRLIAATMKYGFILAIVAMCVGGWFYYQHLNAPKGPSYGWISNRFFKVSPEDFSGDYDFLPIGEWVPVRVVGGENYELRIFFLAREIDEYPSTGEHGISEGANVFVWEIHRVIERRSKSGNIHGAKKREEYHVEAHVWYPEKTDNVEGIQGYSMKTIPFSESSEAQAKSP